MVKKDINLSIMYTPYTIDTYNTFTMETAEGCIMEDQQCEYDDIEWNYDHREYLQALADSWIELMNKNILDDVILKVEADGKAISPKEYNYRTDDCDVIFTVNINQLKAYIDRNSEDYAKNKIGSVDGFMWFGDDNETMLHYYLKKQSVKHYDAYAYYIDQMESVNDFDYIDYKIIKK